MFYRGAGIVLFAVFCLSVVANIASDSRPAVRVSAVLTALGTLWFIGTSLGWW